MLVGAQVTVPPSKPPTLGTSPLYELTVEHVIAVNASEFLFQKILLGFSF